MRITDVCVICAYCIIEIFFYSFSEYIPTYLKDKKAMSSEISFGGDDTIIVGGDAETMAKQNQIMLAVLLVIVLFLLWRNWGCIQRLCRKVKDGFMAGGLAVATQELGDSLLGGDKGNPYIPKNGFSEGYTVRRKMSPLRREGYMKAAPEGYMVQMENMETGAVEPTVVADVGKNGSGLAAVQRYAGNNAQSMNSRTLVSLLKQADMNALQKTLQCDARKKDYDAHANYWGWMTEASRAANGQAYEGMAVSSANSVSDMSLTGALHGQ